MGLTGLTEHACGRGEIDDPPTAALEQFIGRSVGQESATGIDRKNPFPLAQRDALGAGIGRNARRVYQHVQSVELFAGPGKGRVHRMAVSDVADSRVRPTTTVTRYRGDLAQVETDDMGTLLYKRLDHCRANTAGASRDDDPLTGQLHGLFLLCGIIRIVARCVAAP
ncbi:hypothetical protein D3C76_1042930 [compost metagenome]